MALPRSPGDHRSGQEWFVAHYVFPVKSAHSSSFSFSSPKGLEKAFLLTTRLEATNAPSSSLDLWHSKGGNRKIGIVGANADSRRTLGRKSGAFLPEGWIVRRSGHRAGTFSRRLLTEDTGFKLFLPLSSEKV